MAPPPGLNAAWSVEGLEPLAGDRFVEELDPCAICCEELASAPVLALECGHRYHDTVTAGQAVALMEPSWWTGP